MRMSLLSIPLLFLGGCAATSEMSSEELKQCLQPNRRVVIEVVGLVQKPPPKKPAAPPPEAKAAEAKPVAEAKPKPPAKPEMAPFEERLYVQGDQAFDFSGAALKEGGKHEIDAMLAKIQKRAVKVNAIIVQGHADRLESENGNKALSEQRAAAAKDYLISRGQDQKVIFWEGKGSGDPVPVTKFCSS